ncbi:MAG: hypothetical protein HZA52_11210 [Planctomycetes bacterium]|nr:hypothetical protein [Planctomycetota bacterium]
MSLILACLLQSPNLEPIYTIGGPWFGQSLVRVSDQDGDRRDDLAVGSVPLTGSGGRCSVVYLYSTRDFKLLATLRGSTCDARPVAAIPATPIWPKGALVISNEDSGYEVLSLHDARVRWKRVGVRPCMLNSSAAETVGDVDGDGVGDFAGVVRAPGGDVHVELFSGLAGVVRWVSRDVWGSLVTPRLCVAPDFDGDGIGELWMVEGAGATALDTTRVELLSGRSGQSILAVLHPHESSGRSEAVASIPDIDGDRVADLALGFEVEGSTANPPSGWVDVLSGATGETIFRVDARRGDGEFGAHLAASRAAPCPRWAIAAHGDLWFDAPGCVVIVERGAREPFARFAPKGRARGFGAALEFVPDLDGDGFEELAATALEWEWEEADDGFVTILDGGSLSVIRELRPPAW